MFNQGFVNNRSTNFPLIEPSEFNVGLSPNLAVTPLKKESEKEANTATRDSFFTTFGKALMLMRKDKPDICPNFEIVLEHVVHINNIYTSNKRALQKSLTIFMRKHALNVKVIVIIKYYVNYYILCRFIPSYLSHNPTIIKLMSYYLLQQCIFFPATLKQYYTITTQKQT